MSCNLGRVWGELLLRAGLVQVYESTKLTTEEKTVITEVLQPLFVMLNNTQSGELMGTNASATATL